MSTATRSRGFPNYSMPSSNDKTQQPIAGFPGSNLYPNKNIWTSSFNTARDRSIGAKDTDESPSGSSALNANSEADISWGQSPWKAENPSRSTSTSPNRTRDGGMSNGASFFEPAIGLKKNTFPGNDANGYGSTYATQKRGSQDAIFMDSMTGFASGRDQNPPSRQSQGSPAFSELYRGHTPSNSIHSHRPMPSHSSSFQNQTANQRAFQFNNKQMEEDLSLQFSRGMTMENTAAHAATAFNPASQPFQMTSGSQTWPSEPATSRFSNSVDLSADPLAAQFNAMKRGSVDRVSPASAYRFDQNNSPRGYAPSPDPWNQRTAPRDPRTLEQERRIQATPFTPPYASYFASQYPYGNLAAQYPNLLDPYAQNFRPMLPGYTLPPMQYPMNTNVPIRPARDQDPGKGMRSALLDEFRLSSKSNKRFELKDIYNYVVEFSGDQHGSRFIQQKLETANSDEKDQVFREIEPNAIQLMKDVFGNYVIQKFFEHGNQVQKKVLAEKMKGKVVDLSVQVYACRVVQKAMEHVLVEQQAELTRELEPDILRVIRDQNGNHVVQKIIELVPREYIDFIMNATRGQVAALSSHAYGCRVIQRLLEYGSPRDKADIMAELHASSQILITDQYGNYVAQHVIENGQPEDQQRMIQLVMSQVLTLSKHKFASNVVEKCIECGSEEQRVNMRRLLTDVGSDGTSPLQLMMKDQYGNYVIQKLLSELKGEEREILKEELKGPFYAMKKLGSSRQLLALEKLLELGGANGTSKGGSTSAQADSSAPTPVLTNETNSPQSVSPRSINAGTIAAPAEDGVKASGNGVTPQVQVNEA